MTAAPMPIDPLRSIPEAVASIDTMPLAEQAGAFEGIHRIVTLALSAATDRADTEPSAKAR